MKLSASSLKTYSKCSYKFYLSKVKGEQEPGDYNYGMLQGKVMGTALEIACTTLNKEKTITETDIAYALIAGYRDRFTDAGIPTDIQEDIVCLLTNGPDPANMANLDALSHSINESRYKFKVPAPLKTKGRGPGGTSTDKNRFGMIVQIAYENLLWFFQTHHPWYADIRDAVTLEHERYVEFDLGNGHFVTGYLDQYLVRQDGTVCVSEFKTDKTAYWLEFVENSVQNQTYLMMKAPVRWFDITHQTCFVTDPDPQRVARIQDRYRMAVKGIQAEVFVPVCGLDPFTSRTVTCGYKCGICPYSDGAQTDN